MPSLTAGKLKYRFGGPAIRPGLYEVGTAEFRYWTAAEALRRGADFWTARLPSLKWQTGSILNVLLDEGVDFNAYYDRQALNFFHGQTSTGIVYSGESPDILCHEMGHAVLDGLKPQLWNVASHEAAAFHEAFGDMSAMLAALQLPIMRQLVLSETSGHINRNSRLSRLAEQLGAAIRETHPDAVSRDSLRNAANSFTYQDPLQLPSSAPAAQLSAEPHSFSRVFTGAFLDALAGMLVVAAGHHGPPTEQDLETVSQRMGDILLAGIQQAPVVSNFYAQVAAGMVQASAAADPAYPRVLKSAFIRRHILSLSSAAAVEPFQAALSSPGTAAGRGAPSESLGQLALAGNAYGLGDRPLVVETPSQPRHFPAKAAANAFGSIEPSASETTARGFVEDLFLRGKVDCDGAGVDETRMDPVLGLKTHRLVDLGRMLRLERRLCDCGLCRA
ncbi:hypothetical protein [Microvirga calopogonii]|uniref:hypothetical protein n=1 Tax=Microvirga calopogonii TaxID=2078013 RepID=UPI00197B149B|nr:hypothetical protein [Microvirga calopogonii]